MRRSNLSLTRTAVALKMTSLLVIAAGLVWILTDDIRRRDPVAARAEPLARIERGILQR
jgi:hypothetical protein